MSNTLYKFGPLKPRLNNRTLHKIELIVVISSIINWNELSEHGGLGLPVCLKKDVTLKNLSFNSRRE